MSVEERGGASEASDETWAIPPKRATGPGRRFFEQQERDLHFISSDARFLEYVRSLVDTVAHAVLPDADPREAFRGLYGQVERLEGSAIFNDQVRAELVATRFVDNYLVYVSEFISELFRARPETLRSAETIRLDDVLQHESLEGFIAWLADERVNRLSYKGFGEIETFVQKRFGFDLVGDPQNRRDLVRAIALRNLIVHRRGIVDSRFLTVLDREHFASTGYRIGERIPSISNFDSLPAIVSGIRHVEGELVRKFDIPTSDLRSNWPHSEGSTSYEAPTDGPTGT